MSAAPPTTPFGCRHSPVFPELLAELGVSLAATTQHAGKVIAIAADGDRIVVLPRSFDAPMGIALEGERLAVATRDQIVLLANEPRLAGAYPRQPDTYDALYLPRSIHFCGEVAVHDLAWVGERLVGVNTLFSCLFELDARFSFRPIWRPAFVEAAVPEDACHLNGLAVDTKGPRYATAFAATGGANAWRDASPASGVVLDVASGGIVVGDLAMPHSPRLVEGQLFVLASATGALLAVDTDRGSFEVVNRVPGFARGLARHGDYWFVGTSRLRAGGAIQRSDAENRCGISVLHAATGARVAELEFLRSCDQIYDVAVLPARRPGILGIGDDTHRQALATPDATFWSR
ncbi:MAG: TIGR03032 family protein [Myxococcota bacterium]